MNIPAHQPLSPAAPYLGHITECWDNLAPEAPFQDFFAHVRSRRPLPRAYEDATKMTPLKVCCPNPSTGQMEDYRPTYTLAKTPAGWKRQQKAGKLEQLALLEFALAYYFAAKSMVPKPTKELLASAFHYCELFNEKHLRVEEIVKKHLHNCAKGGETRQRRLNPVREYAQHLYRTMSPPEGWKNTAMAIRAITPTLKAYVKKHRLPVFAGDDDGIPRIIRGWLPKANTQKRAPIQRRNPEPPSHP